MRPGAHRFQLIGQGQQRGFSAYAGGELGADRQAVGIPMQRHRHGGGTADVVQRGVSHIVVKHRVQFFESKFGLIPHPRFEYLRAQHRRQQNVPFLEELVDQPLAVDVVAVGMWATRLRCPSCPQRCRMLALGQRSASLCLANRSSG